MSKKILLIESDAAFAREMAAAIEMRGLHARVTGDGREGLDLARADRPDAIILCVELPKMSGYSVCNKLKKDDELKSIPLIIISAEATPATFEQHRKLKTHAEDYLLKPFDAAALLQKIAGLVALPPESAADEPLDEEIVTLDDVEELEAFGEVTSDAGDLPTEGVGLSLGQDEDLKLFDAAFDALAAPSAGPAEASADPAELLAASLSESDAAPSAAMDAAGVDAAVDNADAALAALGLEDPPDAALDAAALGDPAEAISRDGVARERAADERARAADEAAIAARTEANERVRRADERAAAAEERSAEAAARAQALGRELDVERARVAELKKRVAELEAQTTRHEERVVKAYQKIKGDEKIREKTRKALAIALQLLEDRPAPNAHPPAPTAEVQPRRE
jgi:DNA-binding response OmpR family regulator